MSLAKSFAEINLEDIKSLQTNRTTESDVLDYKTAIDEDDEVIRHANAFGNTQGGRIIFGIRESGKGGYPKDLVGVPNSEIRRERLEQVLLSNISPRLETRMKEIPMSQERSFLLLEVPDSGLKPHMVVGRGKYQNKYFKRFQFEAQPMTELEVSDAYRRRFIASEQTGEYLKSLLGSKYIGLKIFGHFVVIPTHLNFDLVDTTQKLAFEWAEPGRVNLEPNHHDSHSYVPGLAQPSSDGVIFQVDPSREGPFLQVHRNGCVEYWRDYIAPGPEVRPYAFPYLTFCKRLMHTLQFASMLYSRVNYFGDVIILSRIIADDSLRLDLRQLRGDYFYHNHTIVVQRQFPSAMLESDFSYIASGIMDETFNHFGAWRCDLFDQTRKWISERFRM